jgi:hypothetical protein
VEDVLHALPPTDLDRSGGYVERYGIKPRFGRTEADATRTGADVEDPARRTSDRPRVAAPSLRTELAEPELAFMGRREDFEIDGLGDQIEGQQSWTSEGLTELVKRLEQEGYLQAQVIRTAARQHGRISRDQIYELGGYPGSRTLRGFPLPINRITRQLQNEALIPLGVSPALRTVHGPDGRVTHFEIPPDVQLFADPRWLI